MTSTPARTNSSIRSSLSGPTPTAAPTRSLPSPSLQAFGCSVALRISFTVIKPRNSNLSFTTSTRSKRCWLIKRFASSNEQPSFTVIKRSRGVILLFTGASKSSSKRRSRFVIIPTTSLRTRTGNPEKPCSRESWITWRKVTSGLIVIGSRRTPDS